MVDGYQKGAQFERETCERLSLWVSNLTREDSFWRSASSGGRATTRSRRTREKQPKVSAHAGDVVATHESGNLLIKLFFIECKFYKALRFDLVLYGKIGTMDICWKTPRAQAATHGKPPLCIVKENRKQALVLTDDEGLMILRLGAVSKNDLKVQAYFPQYGMHVLYFRDVLTECDFNLVRAAYL